MMNKMRYMIKGMRSRKGVAPVADMIVTFVIVLAVVISVVAILFYTTAKDKLHTPTGINYNIDLVVVTTEPYYFSFLFNEPFLREITRAAYSYPALSPDPDLSIRCKNIFSPYNMLKYSLSIEDYIVCNFTENKNIEGAQIEIPLIFERSVKYAKLETKMKEPEIPDIGVRIK